MSEEFEYNEEQVRRIIRCVQELYCEMTHEQVNAAINDGDVYRVICDPRQILVDMVDLDRFTDEYFLKVGRIFVHEVAHGFIANNVVPKSLKATAFKA